jgi:cyclase
MATKKRLIFSLLYSDGYFCQSRNFRCQKVGNYDWLFNNYKFSKIAGFLDELIIINVNPIPESYPGFLDIVKRIVENVYIPVAIGGGIYSVDIATDCLNSGADKVILNSTIRKDCNAVSAIINGLGSQSVVASIDYKSRDGQHMLYDWEKKEIIEGQDLGTFITTCHDLEFGEILLNSVEKDGTGFGFDIDIIKEVSNLCKLPLIVMGGAGKSDHFSPAFEIPAVDAVATANLLNFIGDSLPETRIKLLDEEVDLARFINED